MVNRRPIAFKEALRDTVDVPNPITPEQLIKGYELVSICMIPDLQFRESADLPWEPAGSPPAAILTASNQLKKARDSLTELYHTEYVAHLVCQAVDVKDRFKQVEHESVMKGDLVLLREPHTKPLFYPLARVLSTQVNSLGEVTGAVLKKRKDR
jgi:hypothetical protein